MEGVRFCYSSNLESSVNHYSKKLVKHESDPQFLWFVGIYFTWECLACSIIYLLVLIYNNTILCCISLSWNYEISFSEVPTSQHIWGYLAAVASFQQVCKWRPGRLWPARYKLFLYDLLFDFQFYICSYLHRLTPQWSRQFLISCCLSIYQVHGLFWLMISWSKCTGLLLQYACVLLQFSLLTLFLMCEHKIL